MEERQQSKVAPLRPKIGMLLEAEFPPDVRVENEALALAEAGFEVHLFSLTFEKRPVLEEWKPGIWVHRKALSRQVFKKIHITVLKWPFYRNLWQKFVLREKVGLAAIHVHDLPLAQIGANLSRQLNIPLVLDFHENYPAALDIWEHSQTQTGRLFLDVPSWRRYEFRMVQQASRVIVVVEEALERFCRAGFSLEKFVVISNVLNLKSFPLRPEEGGKRTNLDHFHLSYVGGFGVHRGLETAIQALPLILKEEPAVRLNLVGAGRNFLELKQLARSLDIEEHVYFPGWVSFEESARFIQAADICLIPHLSTEHTDTTVPHKLFQYMYLKKPVLVSSSPPLKRIVEETRAGLVFEAGHPADLAEKFLQMIRSGNLVEWGENGHRAVVEKYNWKKESEKLIRIYRDLLGSS